jgi:hypothetical protein
MAKAESTAQSTAQSTTQGQQPDAGERPTVRTAVADGPVLVESIAEGNQYVEGQLRAPGERFQMGNRDRAQYLAERHRVEIVADQRT